MTAHPPPPAPFNATAKVRCCIIVHVVTDCMLHVCVEGWFALHNRAEPLSYVALHV